MSFAKKGLTVAAGTYATLAVQVIQTMVLSRALGPDGSGHLAFYRTTCLLGFQLASLGLSNAMIHEINKGLTPPYVVMRNVLRATILTSLVATVGMLLLTGCVFREFFGNMELPMLIAMGILVPSFNLKNIFLNYSAIDLNAKHLAAIAFFPPLVLVLWYLFAWKTIGITASWAAFADAIVYAAGGAALGWWVSRKSIAAIRREYLQSDYSRGVSIWTIQWKYVKQLVSFGLQLLATDLLILVNGYVLLFLMRLFTPASEDGSFSEIGIYSRGLRLATLTVMSIQGLQRLLYSNWSKLSGSDQLRSVERVVNACFVMVLALGVFVVLAAKPLTLFLFGKEFLAAVAVTRITLLGLSAYMIVYLLQSFFNSLKQTTHNLKVFSVGLIVNLICGLILIPSMQSKGAAWAVNCSYLAMAIVALKIGCGKYGLRFSAMFRPDIMSVWRTGRSLLKRKTKPTAASTASQADSSVIASADDTAGDREL